MKPLAAMGLVLVLVGIMLAFAIDTPRLLGGALLVSGLVMVVYGSLPRGSRSSRNHGPYSWEKDENGGPREVYTANPGEVHLKTRHMTQQAEFTEARPGHIPMPRQQVPRGSSSVPDLLNMDSFDLPPMAPLPPAP